MERKGYSCGVNDHIRCDLRRRRQSFYIMYAYLVSQWLHMISYRQIPAGSSRLTCLYFGGSYKLPLCSLQVTFCIRESVAVIACPEYERRRHIMHMILCAQIIIPRNGKMNPDQHGHCSESFGQCFMSDARWEEEWDMEKGKSDQKGHIRRGA